jgi:hypothetical protein
MKLTPNLAGSLRFYFSLARALCMVFAAFWLLTLVFAPWLQKQFVDQPKLMVTVGEVMLPADLTAVALNAPPAKPGSLALSSLRGTLQMDLISQDAALLSALRWTILPSVAVFIAFAWVVFGSLRHVCANIEQGQVFTDENLRLMRGIGLALLAYAAASLVVGLWTVHSMNGYLGHVVVTGLPIDPHLSLPGMLRFLMPSGLLSVEASVVTGALVMVLAAAFRQGLHLKTENDLTV